MAGPLPRSVAAGQFSARRILGRYRAGLTVVEIADELGCATTVVVRTLIALDEPRRPKGRRAVPVSDKKILDAYRSGLTAAEVAERFRISVGTVRRRVTAAGIARYPVAGPGGPVRLDRDEIVRRYRRGESVAEIAAAVGASTSGVRHALASRGVSLRRPALA